MCKGQDLSVLGCAPGEVGGAHAGDEIRERRARGRVALQADLPLGAPLLKAF